MRITNKIMQNNNLSNINTNKILEDKLSTQMSTQKKINKPSDDPVVAIRALRLRSNVTEATQYYSKNIPDAKSWLEVTEGALKNTADVLTNMRSQCVKGSNGDLTSGDREIILEQLKALRDEVYSTANVDYAGRYVFAGHRTDTTITFTGAKTQDYKLTEQLDNSAIDEFTYIKAYSTVGGDHYNVGDIDTTNAIASDIHENDISSMTVHRLRLAYSDVKDTIPVFERVGKDAAGNLTTTPIATPEKVSINEIPNAYELAADPANKGKVYFIPETGELILGDDIYADMMAYKDDPTSATINEGEIRITYEKSSWLKGDLRPEHYYACTTAGTDGLPIDYNSDYLTGSDVEKQVIEYDVGFNQTIRVNTTADECFDPSIARSVDDLISSLEEVQDIEKSVKTLEKMVKEETDDAKKEQLQTRLDAANKALTLSKDKMQKMFEKGITIMQDYLDANSLAITNCGTRSSKLALVENRMMNQKTTYETLKSENEDIDIAEVVIQLNSAELTYNASLMATGKIMQTNLMNFI